MASAAPAAILPANVSLPANANLPANDRVVLYNVSWETYATLRENLGDSPIRLTYDGSDLEIMSPSRWHELAGRFLGRMIGIWRYDGENLRIDVLRADGSYHSSASSLSFPILPVGELARFLSLVHQSGETQCLRMFMQWLREQNFKV